MSQQDHIKQQLERSKLFDAEWYLKNNQDVRTSGLDPWFHYLNYGLEEGRLPGPLPHSVPGGVFRVLYVLSLKSGGTPQTNEDLMAALASLHGASIECYVLRCIGRQLELLLFCHGAYITLARHTLAAPVAAVPHTNDEYDAVAGQWLQAFGVSLVHVRHSAYQSLGLMDSAQALGVPVVYSFHDYYTVCPSVKLLDENRQFCGGRCTASRGECYQELWPDSQLLPLKHESVYAWQGQFAGALAMCSAFVATVGAVKNIMVDVFPALANKPFSVIPHGRDFDSMAQLAVQPVPNQPLRVLIPGHIAVSKGAEILMGLAAMPELAHVQWHVLGTLQQGFDEAAPNSVVVHGAYERADFQRYVAEIKPHMGALLSIWPETWCHTLTELWAAGLPVLGFDIGAVGERLKQSGAGWLAKNTTPAEMSKTLFEASHPGEWSKAVAQVKHWQKYDRRSCTDMAADYWGLYNRVSRPGI